MYCWLVAQAVAGLAARQAQASYALEALAVVVLASGNLCSLAQRCLLRTPLALCLSVLALAVQQGQASPMPGHRAVMQVVRAATLRSAHLPQRMAAVVVVQALVLLLQVLAGAEAASAQRV